MYGTVCRKKPAQKPVLRSRPRYKLPAPGLPIFFRSQRFRLVHGLLVPVVVQFQVDFQQIYLFNLPHFRAASAQIAFKKSADPAGYHISEPFSAYCSSRSRPEPGFVMEPEQKCLSGSGFCSGSYSYSNVKHVTFKET